MHKLLKEEYYVSTYIYWNYNDNNIYYYGNIRKVWCIMRLWHERLIKYLPRQQLLGQHRECAALRGNGWNKNHSTINYIFRYSPYKLYQYHILVMTEMVRRGYNVKNKQWFNPLYRGKNCRPFINIQIVSKTIPIYKEHDDAYLKFCINKIKEKAHVKAV